MSNTNTTTNTASTNLQQWIDYANSLKAHIEKSNVNIKANYDYAVKAQENLKLKDLEIADLLGKNNELKSIVKKHYEKIIGLEKVASIQSNKMAALELKISEGSEGQDDGVLTRKLAHREKQIKCLSKKIEYYKVYEDLLQVCDVELSAYKKRVEELESGLAKDEQIQKLVSTLEMYEYRDKQFKITANEKYEIRKELERVTEEQSKKIAELEASLELYKQREENTDRQLAEKIVEVSKAPVSELADDCNSDDEPELKEVEEEKAEEVVEVEVEVVEEEEDEAEEEAEEVEKEDFVTLCQMNELIKELNAEREAQNKKMEAMEARLKALEAKEPEEGSSEDVLERVGVLEDQIETYSKGAFILDHIDFQGPKVKKVHNLNMDNGTVQIRFAGPSAASASMTIEQGFELIKKDMETLKSEELYVQLEGEIAGQGKVHKIGNKKFTEGTIKKVKRPIGKAEVIAEMTGKKEDENGEKHIVIWEILGEVKDGQYQANQRREQMWETYNHENELIDVQIDYI
jgi:hypothetical protein